MQSHCYRNLDKAISSKGLVPQWRCKLRLSPGAPLVCCAILGEATLAARDTASGEQRVLGMQPNDPVCVITKVLIHCGKHARSSYPLSPTVFSVRVRAPVLASQPISPLELEELTSTLKLF